MISFHVQKSEYLYLIDVGLDRMIEIHHVNQIADPE